MQPGGGFRAGWASRQRELGQGLGIREVEVHLLPAVPTAGPSLPGEGGGLRAPLVTSCAGRTTTLPPAGPGRLPGAGAQMCLEVRALGAGLAAARGLQGPRAGAGRRTGRGRVWGPGELSAGKPGTAPRPRERPWAGCSAVAPPDSRSRDASSGAEGSSTLHRLGSMERTSVSAGVGPGRLGSSLGSGEIVGAG